MLYQMELETPRVPIVANSLCVEAIRVVAIFPSGGARKLCRDEVSWTVQKQYDSL